MKKTFTILLTLILSVCMLMSFAVTAGAQVTSKNEIIPMPDIPTINRPYDTVEKIGIDIDIINALFPAEIKMT